MLRGAAVVVLLGVLLHLYTTHVWLPGLTVDADWNACWSAGSQQCGTTSAASLKPAPLQVSDAALAEIKEHLSLRHRRSSLTKKPFDAGSIDYGVDADGLETLLTHWETKYDWRAAEARYNAMNPRKAVVDGLEVHFLTVKAKTTSKKQQQKKKKPLLVLHGWPGSVWEFMDFVPALAALDDSIEFVVPSLPGYGWSEGAAKPGLDACAMAVMMSKLMTTVLGYTDGYYVQGGDWGSFVAHCMVEVTPAAEVLGMHVNMPLVVHPWWSPLLLLTESDPEQRERLNLFTLPAKVFQTTGYMHLQATKPHTLGAVLDASPVATAAWMFEKFEGSGWTDPRSNLSHDQLITNLLFYWLPAAQGTAARMYKESLWGLRSGRVFGVVARKPVTTKTGLSTFPREIIPPPHAILSSRYHNIVTHDTPERGGHFAAFEQPEILAKHVHGFLKACSEADDAATAK